MKNTNKIQQHTTLNNKNSLRNKIKLNNRYLSSSSSNNNNNNNNFNRYIWYGIPTTIIIALISYFYSFKSVLFIYIIITFMYIIYLVLDLFILIFFVKNKITTPSYLPDYLRNWLLKKEEISQSEVEFIRISLDLDIRNILVYLVILLFIIIIYLYF